MDVAKRRFWLVSTGLVTFIVFAAVAQIASNEWNETASLNEATQLWDMSNEITSEEMKHAIKSELSSTFQKENENLQTALAISNDPSDDLLHSSSNDRRKAEAELRLMRRYGAKDSTFSTALAGGKFSTTSDPMTDLLQTGYSNVAFPLTAQQLSGQPAGADVESGDASGRPRTPFLDTLEDWAEERSADGESGNIPRDSALPPGTPDLRKRAIPPYAQDLAAASPPPPGLASVR